MALDLDARQRAMLQEMGVRVWWPQPAAAEAAEAASAATARPADAVTVAAAQTEAARVLARAAAGAAPQPSSPALPPATAAVPVPVPAAAPRAPALQPRPAGVEAMDWPALQAAVAGCRACKLCTSRKNTVFGVGRPGPAPEQPPQVDWLVVGEAPGENEDLQGEPFVGQAGKLLDNMLKALGLSRRAETGAGVFITNVLKCRPPGNRNPEPEEIAQCEPFLRRQIELLQPKIILAVGRFAVQSLLQATVPDVQSTPLGRLRGHVYRYHGVPVVVSYHPAYLLRSLPEKAKAWADLCLALDVMRKTQQPAG